MTRYFINPVIDALATAAPEERPALIRRIAACVGDEAALRAILGIDPEEFANFYPDMQPPELTTEATIDSFISIFASKKDGAAVPVSTQTVELEPEPEPEPLYVAPAIDYASMLEDSDPVETDYVPEDETSDLISSFLQAVPPKKPAMKRKPVAAPAPVPEEKPMEKPESAPAEEKVQTGPVSAESNLSEELFKLMVKNKNYAKALEIISELSLNNPKKSIYFAYQMRFLEKLIKNQEKSSK